MGTIICISSLKGGVGKTTTAVNLSAAFATIGKKTLMIDCDPQGSATTGVGFDKRKLTGTLYDALMGKIQLADVIFDTDIKDLRAIPVRGEFFRAELELISKPGKEQALRKLIGDLRTTYDYIILDTPPSLGLISINALVAADTLLIPLQCEFLAYESLLQLLRFAHLVRKRLNQNLKLSGVLLTMYDMGEKISHQIATNARERLKTKVFSTVIPRSVQLREASSIGRPILYLDPKSVGALSHLKLAQEIMERDEGTASQAL